MKSVYQILGGGRIFFLGRQRAGVRDQLINGFLAGFGGFCQIEAKNAETVPASTDLPLGVHAHRGMKRERTGELPGFLGQRPRIGQRSSDSKDLHKLRPLAGRSLRRVKNIVAVFLPILPGHLNFDLRHLAVDRLRLQPAGYDNGTRDLVDRNLRERNFALLRRLEPGELHGGLFPERTGLPDLKTVRGGGVFFRRNCGIGYQIGAADINRERPSFPRAIGKRPARLQKSVVPRERCGARPIESRLRDLGNLLEGGRVRTGEHLERSWPIFVGNRKPAAIPDRGAAVAIVESLRGCGASFPMDDHLVVHRFSCRAEHVKIGLPAFAGIEASFDHREAGVVRGVAIAGAGGFGEVEERAGFLDVSIVDERRERKGVPLSVSKVLRGVRIL